MAAEEQESRLTCLKNTRESYKAKLANFTKFVGDFNPNVKSIEELQIRIEKIDKTYNDFDEVSTDLEILDTSSTKIKNHRKERQTFESEFYDSMGKARKFILQSLQQTQTHQPASNISPSPQHFTVQDRIHLPPINLPIFDGSRENWSQFHDAFKALIHEDNKTPNNTKLRYLKGCLTGSVKGITEHYETTDDNYLIAWDLLSSQFQEFQQGPSQVSTYCESSQIPPQMMATAHSDAPAENLNGFSFSGSTTDRGDTQNICRQTLLSTAVIFIGSVGERGVIKARCILDSGSMSNFITTALAKRLGVSLERPQTSVTGVSGSAINIRGQLERFWHIEECQTAPKIFSKEEKEVEEHFIQNTRRDVNGQFIVKLPLRDKFTDLGESYDMALKRFYSLERRLNREPELKKLYSEFMSEYIEMGHMSLVLDSEISTPNICYYLPHHGVLKQSSLTTKLRTVFDASAKSSSGLSLNDVLKVGPVVQDDLFSVLTRFRKHNYVMSADIAKMFRCVSVDQGQRDLQRIIWRPDSSDVLKIYRLNTVTYGQACSSFLAVRCLYQVGVESEETFPLAARAIKRDFYCDDFLSGSDTIDGCIRLRREVSDLLEKGSFLLRKWASNEPSILHDAETHDIFQYIINNEELKTLGIWWDTKLDLLGFSLDFEIPQFIKVTKRAILSIISKLFDPLGLAGPVLIQAKLILQDLWKLALSWDEAVPLNIRESFLNFCEELKSLARVKIPRQAILKNNVNLQVHGFCDSSEKSYGACVMLRSVDSLGNCNVSLLCAKARIAPLKTQTLPRLELMGAVILSRLMDKSVKALEIELSESSIFYWTDSTIVLCWLHSDPSNLKSFVANRVAEVQQLTNINQWRHVRTHDNPADIISRGATPNALLKNRLWWDGPHWLTLEPHLWPKDLQIHETKVTDLPEKRKDKNVSLLTAYFEDSDIFVKFSSFPKLQRVFAYILRFIKNLKFKRQNRLDEVQVGPLTVQEFKDALLKLTFIAQSQMFAPDIEHLHKNGTVSKKSKILSLNPYLDKCGLLRVGGRIKNSDLSHDHKHPLLIKNKHPFSLLVIQYEHIRNFHAGAQATLYAVRQRFWLVNGRNSVRAFIRSCVTCFKANPTPNVVNQMADLPERRVVPARAFLKSGVDFAGPFLIKNMTKAVHFEICTDLSSETFLAALKRFISRRGICQSLLSDNGSNFIGARRELHVTDLQVLTPAHFLIGGALKTIPDKDFCEVPINRLSHYQRIQKMYQQFWRRWKNEYLSNLQQRAKWQTGSDKALKVGTMVILKEDNTLPMHWPLGRITELFPGKDGFVRVVNVRTKTGTLRRPTSKICVLPLPDEDNHP
ncbi:uncharacterized protein LOC126735666 [Anthonomus grandis grandis]|uniref:uncharacterized protein LOC126735666 n=1 Tax=Anthonomus grandis grandis TaxID=2921223 RepID=UPI0021650472|nr:uncharacterized protein LOC126735666 [Anthonomus grandis grandis]